FSERGNFGEMSESLRVVVRIYAREYGEEHTRTLATIQSLCYALAIQPQHRTEALGLLRKLLQSSEKVYGPDHTETSLVVRDLGGLLRAFGEFEEAERLLFRALAIDERHGFRLQLIETCRNLAVLYHAQGRLEDAKRWYRRVIELRRWKYQIAQMAMILVDEGKPSEGLRYTRASLLHHLNTGSPGRYGPLLGHRMSQHAFVLLADGQPDSAAYWMSRAIQQMGEQSRPVMEYWYLESAYGVCLARLGRRAEAEPFLARSVPLLLQHRFMEPMRRTVLRLLAEHYRGAGRHEMVSRIELELAAMPSLPERPARSPGEAGRKGESAG
ncbi:MAG TPA: tetratricopeptide repeat protein, partial [Candidatus Eisenbacteria bacterium]